VRQRPSGVSDAAVLNAVRIHWHSGIDTVEHLPVGFGAHHWRASRDDQPVLFVTLDALSARHDLAQLTAAYAGAAALAATGLEFVHAGLTPYAVAFGPAALSVTPWLDGSSPDEINPATTRDMLTRLHQTAPPPIPVWRPLVPLPFANDLGARVRMPWTLGPYGEKARQAILAKLSEVDAWVARYHWRAAEAAERTWVATHGEPHHANQLVTKHGTVLVDWETLKLAPAERDLTGIGDGDPPMLEMFDLEWRLGEINEYATWFAAPHTGTEDDAIAYAGLVEELHRADWAGSR
jgi:spectinomycin phosphotransferase